MKNIKCMISNEIKPPLEDGDYTIEVCDSSSVLEKLPHAVMEFSICGPRFAIDDNAVNAVYPAANADGDFSNVLPHILWNRKTLPWERNGSNIALLLLQDNECVDIKRGIGTNLFADGAFFPLKPHDLSDSDKNQNIQYMEIPTNTFIKTAPLLKEVPYLSHARKNDLGEWLAVTVCNRLPSADGTNCVCAVTLEGFPEDYTKITADFVRIPVLYSWKFNGHSEKAHFAAKISALDAGPFKNPLPPDCQPTDNSFKTLLDNGYFPLPHLFRTGDTTVSLYRGAFSPLPVSAALTPQMTGDALYTYDPDSGVFDVSYAAAWQLGRMLALSDANAAMEILRLKSSVAKKQRIKQLKEMLPL